MTKKISKSRSIKMYLNEYKKDNLCCQICRKKVKRTFLVYKRQSLTKSDISKMKDKINEKSWLVIKNEVIILCRFCREIYCLPESYYFDFLSFYRYLLSDMLDDFIRDSSVHEYILRLRRLDRLLSDAKFKPKNINEFKTKFESKVSDAMLKNYTVVLSRYFDFSRRRK